MAEQLATFAASIGDCVSDDLRIEATDVDGLEVARPEVARPEVVWPEVARPEVVWPEVAWLSNLVSA